MRVLDNAYVLQHVIQRDIKRKRKMVHTMFMDLRAAFDMVKGLNSEKLWKRK